MVEVILSLAAIVLILVLAWGGAVVFGLFYELTSSLLLFFALMVTLRYWYEATRWVESVMPGAGAYGAFGAYWAVFLAGCLPLILVLNRVTQQAVPRYPRFLDAVLGFVLGLIAATILVCCVMRCSIQKSGNRIIITRSRCHSTSTRSMCMSILKNDCWVSPKMILAILGSPHLRKKTQIAFRNIGTTVARGSILSESGY